YKLLVVSNQPGIAQGYFDCAAVERAGKALIDMLAAAGAKVDGFYYCPHFPGAGTAEYSMRCSCRKPRPGLLHAAAVEHDIDLENSWMVGDILNDVEAGKRAGCRTVLVDRGNETEWLPGPFREPDIVLRSLEGLPTHIRQDYQLKISGTK
ncbi:MAG: HAD-IIIA family hydrolase, partial [Proteobacteria bacterium]|nr:HAD-IIIA family hydrolase [Pseudomonadota bacterium]